MVFKALALSQINYAIELYGRKNSTWIKQLQITQNRLLKILFHKNHMINTTLLHQELDMLKVLEHTQLRLILYIYDNRTKYINQRLYTLRNQLNIEVNHYTFNFINKVEDEAIIKWNMLPNLIKILTNRQQFKNKLNEYIKISRNT